MKLLVCLALAAVATTTTYGSHHRHHGRDGVRHANAIADDAVNGVRNNRGDTAGGILGGLLGHSESMEARNRNNRMGGH
uniref:RxLR effector candidate protein n=1 Tax=Hyaloperonospora arabidopsidis (strain Emoy2) TaxID=559515 RepID=M4C4R6_HYAAE